MIAVPTHQDAPPRRDILSWLGRSGFTLPVLLPLVFFLAGCAMAVHFVSVGWQASESTRAATSLLRHGTLADPFMIPTGPTAHVSPAWAAIMAVVYAVCGVDTRAANIVLGVLGAGLYSLGIVATLAVVAALTPGRVGRPVAAGILVACWFVLYYAVTTSRDWDQPLSAVMLVAGWLILLRFERQPGVGLLAIMAALAGCAFLLTAAIMPPLVLALLWMVWAGGGVGAAGRVRRAIIAGAIVAVFVLPWGVRNQVMLGKFIVTRSNAGLELAVGNQPNAQGPSSVGWTLPIHPSVSVQAARAMRDRGEVGYNRDMAALAKGWILADPGRFARVTLTRIRLTFFPDVGWFPIVGATGGMAILWLLGAAKIAALVGSVVLRLRPVQCAVFGVLPLAPYWITHVYLRYQMLTFFTTVVVIATVSAEGARRWRRG
jgi:hypothetical protein